MGRDLYYKNQVVLLVLGQQKSIIQNICTYPKLFESLSHCTRKFFVDTFTRT